MTEDVHGLLCLRLSGNTHFVTSESRISIIVLPCIFLAVIVYTETHGEVGWLNIHS